MGPFLAWWLGLLLLVALILLLLLIMGVPKTNPSDDPRWILHPFCWWLCSCRFISPKSLVRLLDSCLRASFSCFSLSTSDSGKYDRHVIKTVVEENGAFLKYSRQQCPFCSEWALFLCVKYKRWKRPQNLCDETHVLKYGEFLRSRVKLIFGHESMWTRVSSLWKKKKSRRQNQPSEEFKCTRMILGSDCSCGQILRERSIPKTERRLHWMNMLTKRRDSPKGTWWWGSSNLEINFRITYSCPSKLLVNGGNQNTWVH